MLNEVACNKRTIDLLLTGKGFEQKLYKIVESVLKKNLACKICNTKLNHQNSLLKKNCELTEVFQNVSVDIFFSKLQNKMDPKKIMLRTYSSCKT